MKNNSRLLVVLGFLLITGLFSCADKPYGSRSSKFHSSRVEKSRSKERPRIVKEKEWVNNGNTVIKNVESKPKEEKSAKPSSKLQLRQDLITSAYKYLGRPYKTAGKRPETGFDCSGFTAFIFNGYGFQLKGSADDISKLGEQVDKKHAMPGDLAFFGGNGRINHVGIITFNENNQMEIIHSTSSGGVRTDVIQESKYWNSRFLYARTLIETDSFVYNK